MDVEQFMKNLDNCDYTMNMLLKAFRTITGVDGNINSPEVLSNLIFGKMACRFWSRTKTGKPLLVQHLSRSWRVSSWRVSVSIALKETCVT